MTDSHPTKPTRSDLLRIGVTGHRTLDDPVLITKTVEAILNRLAANSKRVRVFSALAEGSDQIVAERALQLGFDLHAPLPFLRDEYKKDFSEEGAATFDQLLAQCSAVLEFANDRDDSNSAYEIAGRIVLEHVDVMIAIWDGQASRGRGGTAQIVQEALAAGIAVVWIHTESGQSIRYAKAGTSEFGDLPDDAHLHVVPDEAGDISSMYEAEVQPRRQPTQFLAWVWNIWFNTIAGKPRPANVDDVAIADSPFAHVYKRADSLATHYTGLYRGSFLANYLLAAIAVSCSIILLVLEGKHAAHSEEPIGWMIPTTMVAELVCVSLIIIITIGANRKRWHERSIDYRFLSEHLRQLIYVAPLGLTLPTSHPPAYQSGGADSRRSWMAAVLRRVVANRGLPSETVDLEFVESWRNRFLKHVVQNQQNYHQFNAGRLHAFHHRLHVFGMVLFCATAAAVAIHVVILLLGDVAHYFAWLTIVTAMLPTWGAALLAIMNHGEFERLEQRSNAMAIYLTSINEEMLSQPSQSIVSSIDLAQRVSKTCLEEVSDWRTVLAARPIRPPA